MAIKIAITGRVDGVQDSLRAYMLMDVEDVPLIDDCTLNLSASGYAVATRAKERFLPHRAILGNPDGLHVDHINGDRLDNRRANLRAVSAQQNMMNKGPAATRQSSRYKGVSFSKAAKRWQAHIMVNRKSLYLGLFSDEEQAALAYDRAAREHFGEYARTNFGPEYQELAVGRDRVRSDNTSGIPNIYWEKRREKYFGRFMIGPKVFSTKQFSTIEEAVSALEELRQSVQ